MFVPLLLGCFTIFISMGIQIVAVVFMLQYLMKLAARENRKFDGLAFNAYALSMVLLLLFTGHMVQMALWAMLFMYLGEFHDFLTAFYHSTVNFASLGYGDIVMSERWRLLGALEASNGVLMFGLSAGTLLSVMSHLFENYSAAAEQSAEVEKN
jgi:hypothetical protein